MMLPYSRRDEAIRLILQYNRVKVRAGRGDRWTYNDMLFSADTETSKTGPEQYDAHGDYIAQENIVVAWTFSARCETGNVCTVYGSRPSEFAFFLYDLQEALPGEKTFIFFHNMAYDWTFLELFMFQLFGLPDKQLNVKPHYPINIEFGNGITLKDSLILAQVRLEKWAEDLDVEHKKACGKWHYEAIRGQSGDFSGPELEYIEHDTLALVECLDKIMRQLHKHVYSIPMTCTGIIREETRKTGRKNRARDRFLRFAPCFELYLKLTYGYHGGYTHNNRYTAGWIWPDDEALQRGWLVACYDFASSYPHRMLVDLFPMERFRHIEDKLHRRDILKGSDTTAYIFTFCARGIVLKDPREPMPYLQLSKCLRVAGAETDNGRIMYADFVEIVLTEIDLRIIDRQYKMIEHVCADIWIAGKRYLPRWFRDLVYKCFEDKTMLKGGDPVAYNLAKARLNSLYGMCCQKSIKPEIIEDYETGEYIIKEADTAEAYQTYLDNNNTILPYFWGVWVTAYAAEALYDLGACVDPEGVWLYSDTDSVYACGWDEERVKAYNAKQVDRLRRAGYGPVVKDGRNFFTGVAELDGVYQEFKGLHSKCYAVRKMDGDIKITVAGVPKKGAKALKDDLANFNDGFCFPGGVTDKLTHYYLYRNEVYIDENGTEYGNSIDLHSCDYVVSQPSIADFLKILEEEDIEVQVYDDE